MRPDSKNCGICQTRWGNTTCFHVTGHGTALDPYIPVPNLDTAATQLLDCGPSGFGAFLPDQYLDPPACCLFDTLDQSIGFNAAQPIYFNSERYDTDNMHDPEQNSNRITFNTEGIYLVSLNVRWSKTGDSAATGDLAAFIRRTGAEFIAVDSMPVPSGDSYAKHSLAIQSTFEAGEYVEAWVQQDVILDDKEQTLRITSERMSPVFSASFLRDNP